MPLVSVECRLSAPPCLVECCAKVFGKTFVKCAKPYFYYGKALLEMSRLETEVLGHATEGTSINAEDSAHPQVLVASLAV